MIGVGGMRALSELLITERGEHKDRHTDRKTDEKKKNREEQTCRERSLKYKYLQKREQIDTKHS